MGRRGARLEDERVRELGADRRRRCATSPTSSAIRARRSRGRRCRSDVVRQFATTAEGELVYNADSIAGRRSSLRRRVEYHGFELEREIEPIDEFPPELADARAARARRSAGARRGAASGGARRIRTRSSRCARRIGARAATTPRLSFADLAALYEQQLARRELVQRLPPRAASSIDADAIVPRAVRERYAALPSTVSVRGRDVEIHYDVEETADGKPFGVARLRIPEKIARNAHRGGAAVTRSSAAVHRDARRARRRARVDVGRIAGGARSPVHRRRRSAELERADDERRRERHERRRERCTTRRRVRRKHAATAQTGPPPPLRDCRQPSVVALARCRSRSGTPRTRAPCSSAARAASRACTCAATRGGAERPRFPRRAREHRLADASSNERLDQPEVRDLDASRRRARSSSK